MIPKHLVDAMRDLRDDKPMAFDALKQAIEGYVAEQVREAWRKPQPADGPMPEPGAWRNSRGVLAPFASMVEDTVKPVDAPTEAEIEAAIDAIDHAAYDHGCAEMASGYDTRPLVKARFDACDAMRALMRRASAPSPSEAEIEEWSGRLTQWVMRQQEGIKHTEGESLVSILRHGQGLMRRAAAAKQGGK